ncbi:MAG: hypothetical protein E4H36_00450 [Spirochaetales bacterium]|nr:MAG: hypothetical protein E4H36_00450 [Spirochaetales bacterium]
MGIKNLVKKDLPLEYRKIFSGEAVFEITASSTLACTIEFSLERNAAGMTNIRVYFKNSIDYPLIPLMRALKAHIRALDTEGRLP